MIIGHAFNLTWHFNLLVSEEPICNTTSFYCTLEGPKCIPSSWVCDGQLDCSDGSDEGNNVCGKYKIILSFLVQKKNHVANINNLI